MEKLEELERKLDKISKKQAEYESTFNAQELDTAKKIFLFQKQHQNLNSKTSFNRCPRIFNCCKKSWKV